MADSASTKSEAPGDSVTGDRVGEQQQEWTLYVCPECGFSSFVEGVCANWSNETTHAFYTAPSDRPLMPVVVVPKAELDAGLTSPLIDKAESGERLAAAESENAELREALRQIRSRSQHSIWRGLSQCFDIADAALARESSPTETGGE